LRASSSDRRDSQGFRAGRGRSGAEAETGEDSSEGLKKINLEQHADTFIEAGFDSIDRVVNDLRHQDLDQMGDIPEARRRCIERILHDRDSQQASSAPTKDTGIGKRCAPQPKGRKAAVSARDLRALRCPRKSGWAPWPKESGRRQSSAIMPWASLRTRWFQRIVPPEGNLRRRRPGSKKMT
jgi:hypothetical protein